MTAEFRAEHAFTPKQLENQRLFRVGPSAFEPELPGDTGKRVVRKLAILTGATAADLVESWGAELLLDKIGARMIDAEKVAAKDPQAINKKGLFYGIGFVEDTMSDEAYIVGMNAILRRMTGLDEVSYPSATAKFIASWTNLGSFASGKFQDTLYNSGEIAWKRPFWKKPWNLVNAVNTEAFIGLLEEMPLVGNAVSKAHAFVDQKLTKSKAVQLVDTTARAATTGYHIVKNMMHDSRPVVPTPAL